MFIITFSYQLMTLWCLARGNCAASIHVFFEVSLFLKSWMSHFGSHGFTSITQPSSLNFPYVHSSRKQEMRKYHACAKCCINSIIQFSGQNVTKLFILLGLPWSGISLQGNVWSLHLRLILKAPSVWTSTQQCFKLNTNTLSCSYAKSHIASIPMISR